MRAVESYYLCTVTPNQTVAFHTLGCKLNFSETSTIARQLETAGFARVDAAARPDVVVINTCSVTENANRKCREVVKRTLKVNPQTYVAVIGCYAQLKPKEIAAIPGVDVVLGANEKFDLPSYLGDLSKKEEGAFFTREIKETRAFVPGYSKGDRTRSFLKVQDGCNYFCAFCTIPLARGRSRSATIEETMVQARELANTEAREVVLTGVNIGDFGTANGENFLDLCKALDDLEGINRFRISSIEPNLLTDEIIDFVATSKRFAPHFHIPLQSGSDTILKRMRRRYLTDLYASRIAHIKKVMPHACIGVDVIVGFPGETDEEFKTTMEFLTGLGVSYLHVFTYSERPNTTALRMDGIVPANKRQERSKQLRLLSSKKRYAFYKEHVGANRPVLFEGQQDEGYMYGFTDNYVKVRTPYDGGLVNQLVSCSLEKIVPDGLMDVQLGNTL